MTKSLRPTKGSRKAHLDSLFIRAGQMEESGKLGAAFRLFLAGAKAGETGCQLNVGNYYDDGTGVRRNRKAALYWYKRAYLHGDASAASNIGVMWRNEKKSKRALEWFKKSVRLGNDEANLEIAKYYLQNENNPAQAIRHLKRVCKSNCVTEAGAEEAAELLKKAVKTRSVARLSGPRK
jgi:TPR repeat protein